MLQTLSIRDFVIVDHLNLELRNGFTVLTGETGAGKSILIDALSLSLGARGEAGVVRAGCERAEIITGFSVAGLPEVKRWLEENEIVSEEHELLLRRLIYFDGRSRAFINGVSSTVQQLKELGELLVDIYSQHSHHSLLKANYQRATLDNYANLTSLAGEVSTLFYGWQEILAKRQEMERNASLYASEVAVLRDQIRELRQLAPSKDEWMPLQQEHSRLSNGANLIEGSEICHELLSESEYAVLSQLSVIRNRLSNLQESDPVFKEAMDSIDSAMIQLEDMDRFINKYIQRLELDPERLNEVESRIHSLHSVARKFRVRPADLSDLLEDSQKRMAELEAMSDDGELQRRESVAKKEYMAAAEKLSQGRQEAAVAIGLAVSEQMQTLSLKGGAFKVSLNHQSPSAAGLETVEFLVAGHAGAEARPLSKVASGGELSRISLAIRVVTASQVDIPTMIFDEVDVGIGGGVAEIVGNLLAKLGKERQVLVITHLPQVASQGECHLNVRKIQQGENTFTTIEPLDDIERIEEIARMLGGVEITDTTRQHAREMLKIH